MYLARLLLLASIAAVPAWAYPGWETKVPNGSVYGCDTCHLNDDFGADFHDAGDQWTASLAAQDSDADGYANGIELLDPDGNWSEGDADPGDPADATNPDDPNSPGGAVIDPASFGEAKTGFAE